MIHTADLVTLLGITAAVGWGISDFFSAKSAKALGGLLGAVTITTAAAVFYGTIYLLFLQAHHNLPIAGFGYAVAASVLISIANTTFSIGLEAGPVSIVSPLSSMYPVITTILALVVFSATLSGHEIIGIALVVLGIVATSGLLTIKKSQRRLGKGPAYALLTALAWGIGYAMLAQAIKRADWQIVSVVELTVSAIMLMFTLPFVKSKETISKKMIIKGLHNKYVLSAALVQTLAFMAINLGLSKSTASGGAVITALSAWLPHTNHIARIEAL